MRTIVRPAINTGFIFGTRVTDPDSTPAHSGKEADQRTDAAKDHRLEAVATRAKFKFHEIHRCLNQGARNFPAVKRPLFRAFAILAGTGLSIVLASCASPTENKVVINRTAVPPVPTLNAQRLGLGEQLYAQHCAECHGVNLEGAANWKQPLADGAYPPPPHDSSGHTWHHPDSTLKQIIAAGGDPAFNSNMPAFKEKLSDSDLEAILEFIKSRWGKDEREFQWWMTYTRDTKK